MALTDDELVTIARQEISQAQGYEDDELTQNRKDALDYFFGRPRGDEVVGNSPFVSLDVADMIEAVLANMMPAFAGDTLVMFEPDSDDDVKQAQLESDIVNNIIQEGNRGYWLLSQSIKDALLMRNAVMKVYVEEIETVVHRQLDAVDEQTVALAVTMGEENEETTVTSIKVVDNEFDDAVLVDAKLKTVITDRSLKVESTDPTTFLVAQNTNSIFLEDARFVAERSYPTRTDLILEGFDKSVVNLLPKITQSENIATQARRQDRTQVTEQEGSNIDHSMDVVERYECYLMVDADEDGIAELHKIILVVNTLLSDEVVDFMPYATGTAICNPHEYNSISLYDKLKPIQDLKTVGIRQWIDNIDANNVLTTVVVEDSTNMDDATSTRAGKVIRVDNLEAVKELPMQNMGASSQMLMDYADKMRSERGGASLDLQGAELQIAGDTAHGIERQFSSREQLAALMTRNISETLIRSLYLLVHDTLRLHMPGEIITRIAGEFAVSDPGEWVARDRVNVKTGLSIGERITKKTTMEQIIAKQTELFGGQMNGVLVSIDGYHNALVDWGKASNIDNPERYFIDPNSQESQQALQGKQEASQQATQKEAQFNQLVFGMQNQLEQARIETDMMKASMEQTAKQQELIFKYFEAQLDAEVEEAKILGKATLDLVKSQDEAGERASQ